MTIESNKSLKLLHSLLILLKTLSTATPLAPIESTREQSFSIISWKWIILGHVNLFLICISLSFEPDILFQLTFSITASLIHSTPTTLAEDSITSYIFSASSASKLAFFCNFSSIYTNNRNFIVLNIHYQPLLTPMFPSKAFSFPIRLASVLQANIKSST